MTVTEMAELYFEYKSATVKDIDKEKRRFENHLKKRIGHIRLHNFLEDDVLKLQHDLKETLSVATIRTLVVTLNAMYKYVIAKKLYDGDIPTSNIKHVSNEGIK
jgi:site-specific recombinase XerD